MKKLLLLLFLMIGTFGAVSAQNTIEKGDNILQLGLGISPNYYTGYSFGFAPTFSLGYQRGIAELGPGTLSLGLIGAFNSRTNEGYYGGGKYRWRQSWTNFLIGPRAEWHYNFDVDKLDFYLGLTIAMRFESYKHEWLDNWKYDDYKTDYGGAHLVGGPHLGLAYYLTNSVGLFAEFGYTINWMTLGVDFKF